MNQFVVKNTGLCLLSVLLFSIPWLQPCCGWLLWGAWVPLLWVEADFTVRKAKGCWRYYALTFLLWNAVTTWWICNSTIWGGIFAVIGNASQMFLIFALFRLAKRKMGAKIGYLFFAVLWIAWEYFYFDAEISFPWLVLGNGFGETTFLVQWYEYTGVLGGSLWVLLLNLLLLRVLTIRKAMPRNAKIVCGALVLTFVIPVAASLIRYFTYQEKENPIGVAVLQPNIDPWRDKFDGMTQEAQDLRLLNLAAQAIGPDTRYLFAPETAIRDVLENEVSQNASVERIDQFLQDHPDMAFVVGASSLFKYPFTEEAPTQTAKRGHGYWYDYFNAAFQLSRGESPRVYHKSKLVVGAEKQPYAKYLKFANEWVIDLGGSMGSYGTQPEATVFPAPWDKSCYIGTAICYESVYGEYFASYVKKGAGLMAVITNDGWWGDTHGYRQHLAFSRLRAIETRRSIARSANTGISALINQRGDYLQKSKWWTKAWLRGNLNINHTLTFYVRYGDLIGRVSVYCLLLLLVYGVAVIRYKR